jgi:hypothetical protein
MTTYKDIDALKAVHGAIVDIVSSLMLNTEHIASLFAWTVSTISHTNVNKCAFAPVPILDAKCQGDVIQGERICILGCTVKFVVAVHDAEDFILVVP